MRKIFRMAYESCSGQCYAHSDVMRIHTLGLSEKGAAEFLKRLLAMHAPSCGNPNLQFRLDHDVMDGDDVFVASFYRYGSLDLFVARTPLQAMEKLIDGVLSWYESDDGKEILREEGVSNRADVCHHGTDEKLVSFALSFSGLSDAEQAAVRAELRV